MKKILILTLVLLGLSFALAAENIESDLYYKSFPILKVYPSRLGYRITYIKSDMQFHTFYVPLEWFIEGAAQKAEALYGEGETYPYFSIFWKNGTFSHFKLYLHKSLLHKSWGNFPKGRDYSEEFKIEEPILEF